MENKIIMTIKPRRIITIGTSYYVSLPVDWLKSLNLIQSRTVKLQIDSKQRMIITPLSDEEAMTNGI